MLNIALLMMNANSADNCPAAMLTVAGKPVIYRQILQLKKMGVTRFIISIDDMNDDILEFSAELRRIGIEAEYVRTLDALGDMLNKNDQFIVMSEGILADDIHVNIVMKSKTPLILALKNDDMFDQYELIDLNHRWSGLAKIDGSLIASLENLPDDSDIHSTLLRLALQKGCALNQIALDKGAIQKIQNCDDADNLSKDYISNMDRNIRSAGVIDLYFFKPLVKHILPKLWAAKSAAIAIKYGALAIMTCAIILMLVKFYTFAFGIAFIGCFVIQLRKYYFYYSNNNENAKIIDIIVSISMLIILLLSSLEYTMWNHYFAATILFLLNISVYYLNFQKPFNRVILSFSDIFFIVSLASIWGLQTLTIWGLSMILAFWIFCGVTHSPNSMNEADS